jgi:toxin ParE1/3/4
MKLRLTPRAARNIATIAADIRDHNPAAAVRVRAAIYKGLETLMLFPRAGRRQETEGVRKLVTRPYPYLVYYTINASTDEIIILAVKHPAQRREHQDM